MKIPLYFVLQSLQKARPTLNFADKKKLFTMPIRATGREFLSSCPVFVFCLQELQHFANAQKKEHRVVPTSSSWFMSLSCKSHMCHNLKKFSYSSVMPLIKDTSFLVFVMQCKISHHPPSKKFFSGVLESHTSLHHVQVSPAYHNA